MTHSLNIARPAVLPENSSRYTQQHSDADYVQPRSLYHLFDAAQKARLYANNYASVMAPCSKAVKERWYAVLERVHSECAAGVRQANERLESDVNAVPVTDDSPVHSVG
ncbi:MAG: catalase-related domain-containing protein [Thiogranum sp.]